VQGLASGYLNLPQETKTKFIKTPQARKAEKRRVPNSYWMLLAIKKKLQSSYLIVNDDMFKNHLHK